MSDQTKQSVTRTDSQELAIKSAVDAVDMASLGLSCNQGLRAVLRALVSLSVGHEVIHDLAKVGFNLANEQHNTLDCEREGMAEKLAALKGARHA